jgi:uncharacterized membrane protein YfcA
VSPVRLLLLTGIGLITGVLNSIAGGGSLLSFPALLALGYPPLVANVTNTVGVFPSSAGGALGYRRELRGQAGRWVLLAAVCSAGTLLGAWLLLVLPDSTFEAAVPVLIATAALLVLVQPWLDRAMTRVSAARSERAVTRAGAGGRGGPGDPGGGQGDPGGPGGEPVRAEPSTAALWRKWPLLLAVLAISVYGGYFGAASGVLLIGVLGLFLRDTLQRINALKTSLVAVVNGVAAVAFMFLGPVVWTVALVLAGSTALGGVVGAVMARRLSDRALRLAVVAVGLAAAIYSAVR